MSAANSKFYCKKKDKKYSVKRDFLKTRGSEEGGALPVLQKGHM